MLRTRIIILGWLLFGACAHAKPLEGVIVRVDGGEVIVDLGTQLGLPATARLEVFRRLVVTHPITKKPIEDRFPIGEVSTQSVGDLLSIVTDVSGLSRKPEVGDYVVFGRGQQTAPVAAAPAKAGAPPVDGQTAAVQAAVTANLGRPIDERIATYEAVLRAFPDGPLTDAVGGELLALRAIRTDLRRKVATPAAPTEPAPPAALTARHLNPGWTQRGDRVQLAVAIVEHEWVAEVRALARRRGAPTWQTLKMTRDGDFHSRVTLPPGLTARGGRVEYVIEAVRNDAVLEAVAGSVSRPLTIEVTDPPAVETAPGGTQATAIARYVDFNTGGQATDSYFQFEAGVDYAIDWRLLKAVRFGVGTVDGEGASNAVIDAVGATRTLNVNYAYAELEVEPYTTWLGASLRLMGGNHRNTEAETSKGVTGAEGRLRIGKAQQTRLVVGGSAFQDLGNQAFTDLHIEVIDRVPLLAGVAVTNLPVDEDLGVRLYARGGYEALDWLTLVVETGWNARTINHNGFTAGGGLALNW